MDAPRKPRSARLSGATVLVVEDDFMIFLGLELTLARAGVYCPTLAEARAFISSCVPRLQGKLVSGCQARRRNIVGLCPRAEAAGHPIPVLFRRGGLAEDRARISGNAIAHEAGAARGDVSGVGRSSEETGFPQTAFKKTNLIRRPAPRGCAGLPAGIPEGRQGSPRFRPDSWAC